jgi:hypothetical protein
MQSSISKSRAKFLNVTCFRSTPKHFILYIQGVLTESVGPDVDDHIFTVVDSMSDVNKNSIVNESSEAFQMNEDEGESSVASVEEQLKKEMTVYEV